MPKFTVIIGSAYHDDTPANYLVEAETNQQACEYALHIAKAHNGGSGKSVLYSFEGAVVFLPTIFDGRHDQYVPEVINLIPPVVKPKTQRWACIMAHEASGRRMTKLAADRNLLSKTSKGMWRLMMPPSMTDERAISLIAELSDITSLGVTFEETPITEAV